MALYRIIINLFSEVCDFILIVLRIDGMTLFSKLFIIFFIAGPKGLISYFDFNLVLIRL